MELDAFILVIILTCGFIYTTKNPGCKFTLLRIKDWIQYLYVFAKGLPFAFVSFLFMDFVYFLSEKQFIETLSFNTVLIWSALAIISARISGYVMSKDEKLKQDAIQMSAEEDSFREKIYDAVVNPKFVQVTLTTRKVYVGLILSCTELSKPNIKYLKICPILSGYRNSEKQLLIFSNNYWNNYKDIFQKFISENERKDISADAMLKVFKKNKNNLKDIEDLLKQLEKFMTVISLDHIVSIANFNVDLYLKINANNQETLGSLLIKAAVDSVTKKHG